MFGGKVLLVKIFVMRNFAKAKASVTVGSVLMGGYGYHRRLEVKFLDLFVKKEVENIIVLYNSGPNVIPLTVDQIAAITSQVKDKAIIEETTCLKAEFILVKGFKGAINILYDVSGT